VIAAGEGIENWRIAVDGQGAVHAASSRRASAALEYLRRDPSSGAWTMQQLPLNGGFHLSIVIDAAGNPIVASAQSPNGRPAIVERIAAAWRLTIVAEMSVVSAKVSDEDLVLVAPAATGELHVVWIGALGTATDSWRPVYHAVRPSGQDAVFGVVELVDQPHVSRTPSLALSPAGEPTLTYYRVATPSPFVATLASTRRSGGVWQAVTVINSSDIYSAHVVDAVGRAHIVAKRSPDLVMLHQGCAPGGGR
jgi:hypothetical protein